MDFHESCMNLTYCCGSERCALQSACCECLVLCCRQIAPRHRLQAAPTTLQAEFALFAFWHEAPSRTPVNSHVVVAGASDCGLSVIESLLMHERLAFNALTLLAPGGLCSGQAAAMYKADLIARLVSCFVPVQLLQKHLLTSILAVTATTFAYSVLKGVFWVC